MQQRLLVSPQWLQDNLANPALAVIENPWINDAYQKAHISGAYCVPGHPYLKQLAADGTLTRRVMGPTAFAELCHALGMRRDRHYVVYDDFYGLFAARFWSVCRHFGVSNISILDGSWRGWLVQGRPVSSRLERPVPGTDLVIEQHPSFMISWKKLLQIHKDPSVQVWDTRREGEYSGEETTDNRRQGHVPGALNLVWTELLTDSGNEGEARFLKPLPEVAQLLTRLGLSRDKTIITYCQSGNRAAFCNFVMELLGFPDHRLYDASMGEWANMPDPPLVTGRDPG